ncbi:5-oxoprolinase subunit PxpB [Cohaesibacter haloalkalitolerans]|uniref:5-oxoprolinase subunit PxpB n=1 Tax=Cohaesibacter haloalkalitolerans TaxID=1162980 RepID=UPI001FE1FF32|nr:5-oxoprolinase subunit PxpB [Cohaesibacter haloalkalitolerans]
MKFLKGLRKGSAFKEQQGHPPARFLHCGDSAIAVELASEIDETANRRVIALAESLDIRPIDGIEELVPTYRSLLVLYDPSIIRGQKLIEALQNRLASLVVSVKSQRTFSIPVLYGHEAGLDLEEMAKMKGITPEEVISIHSSAEYRVYMIGFAPGFAYLGGVPEILHTPRRKVPRQHIVAGSIGIGGKQGNINSLAGPSGWLFLGRTPLKLFDPNRTEPFMLRAGDVVKFRPVEREEALDLDAAVARGDVSVEANIL